MIRFFFFILVLALTLPLLGQTKCDSVQIFPKPDKQPIFDKDFPDDLNKLYQFIFGVIRYPATAREDNVAGEVWVQFWVDTTGFTIEHRIVQSVRQDLDDEVLRIAKLIKFDIPAKNDEKSVGTCLVFPVRFTISGNGKPSKHINKQAKKTKIQSKLNSK
jgi:TonB family protein